MGYSDIRRNVSVNLGSPFSAATRARFAFEQVEPRLFLSAVRAVVAAELRALNDAHAKVCLQPQINDSGSAAGVAGYTPDQIRHAYGFDQINFTGANGAVAGNGAGQTIAIVDAFDDPNIAADLHTFSQTFNLSDPPSFTKVNQTGGSTSSVKPDAGWSGEISLDVEWAHAMAPQANIMLVEANSDSLPDLLSAVDYARNADGVSVVSMSWGTSEFWGQSTLDQHFTTPAGHQGVTFVAASGDFGSRFGPSWPSTSSNVLSVGGTTLQIDDTNDTYVSETGWRLSTGGVSQFESQPTYQSLAQHTGRRTNPDVSYNANPNTGFAVYDSVGANGWTVVGGTSAGAPQWAALIAIANQGRAENGAGSLNSVGTLSSIYQSYSDGDYAADFHDVTVGRTSFFLGAHVGYDGVTGLGSPNASFVVGTLIGTTTTTTGTVTIIEVNGGARGRPSPRWLHPQPVPPPTDDVPVAPAPVAPVPVTPAPVAQLPVASAPNAPVSAATTTAAVNLTAAPVERIAARTIGSQAADLFGGAAVSAAQNGAAAATSLATATIGAAALRGAWSGTAGVFSRSLIALDEAAASAAPALGVAVESLPAALATASSSPQAVLAAITSPASTHKVFEFARFGAPFTLLADSVAAFTEESALIPTSLSSDHRSHSAWLVTMSVIGADAMLLTHYYRKTRKTRRHQRTASLPLECEEVVLG